MRMAKAEKAAGGGGGEAGSSGATHTVRRAGGKRKAGQWPDGYLTERFEVPGRVS